RDDAFVYAGLGMAFEGLKRFPEADGAFQSAFARGSAGDEDLRIRLNLSYGFAVSARLPDKAQAAFTAVFRKNPKHPQALYGQAMVIAQTLPPGIEQGNPDGEESKKKLDLALEFFNRALQANPRFVEARRFRAVLSARSGLWKQAYQEI